MTPIDFCNKPCILWGIFGMPRENHVFYGVFLTCLFEIICFVHFLERTMFPTRRRRIHKMLHKCFRRAETCLRENLGASCEHIPPNGRVVWVPAKCHRRRPRPGLY